MGARTETICRLLLSVLKYGLGIGMLFYCLYLVGVNSTGLIASASVLSLVIGFGAQSLITELPILSPASSSSLRGSSGLGTSSRSRASAAR